MKLLVILIALFCATPALADIYSVGPGGTVTGVFTSLSSAKMKTTAKNIHVSTPVTTNTMTWPTTKTLTVDYGGQINVNSGKTLTINGPFEAGRYLVFNGAGTVVFGTGATKFQWAVWGAGLSDTYPPAPPSYRGALVYNTVGATAGTPIPYTSESYDTDNIHDNSTNTSRLVVPSGVTKVSLSGMFAASTAGIALMYKNGTPFIGSPYIAFAASGNYHISTPTLSVTAGDYFTMIGSGTAHGADSTGINSWFAMEIR